MIAVGPNVQRQSPGPRVVTIEDNYDDLGFTPDAASRDIRYTRYVDDRRILRSHASAMIPTASRALAVDPVDDVLLACPGVVYRRAAIDRVHTGMPHQLDLGRISRKALDNGDMAEKTAVTRRGPSLRGGTSVDLSPCSTGA